MKIGIVREINAPIEAVFAFLDNPENAVGINPHVVHIEVIERSPDGRQMVDAHLSSPEGLSWAQTIDQVVRQPPSRLMTRAWTWKDDRRHRFLVIETDRHLSSTGERTRLEVTIEGSIDKPFRHPLRVLQSWFHRGTAQREFERQYDIVVERIELAVHGR